MKDEPKPSSPYSAGCYVLTDHTNLFLKPPLCSYLIPKVTKSVTGQESVYELSNCPTGLTTYFDHLRNLIKPFLKFKNTGLRPMYLVCGVQGSGKKTVVNSVSQSLGLHVLKADCLELFGFSKQAAEAKLGFVISKAKKSAPCLLLLQNIEVSCV